MLKVSDFFLSVANKTLLILDLDIKTSGTGCVKIQKIECDNCKIETEKGTSVLQSIKSHKIDIRTNGGKVIGLGTLYGNTDICATEKGSVNIEKLQGTTINISTEDGLLKTKYLYAESASLSSESGDIMLGSVHGNTNLQTKRGSITVDSSDGSLKASTYHGTIDVYVSQLRKVDLKSQKGSITVKVPASLKAYLELSGRKVDVSSEIQLKETQSASKDDHVTLSGMLLTRSVVETAAVWSNEECRNCSRTSPWRHLKACCSLITRDTEVTLTLLDSSENSVLPNHTSAYCELLWVWPINLNQSHLELLKH
uniref:protein FAM185A isoform X1 n=1 Tax=Lonchura striata TaxID=40157 RepID=UPI000B4D4668|nr:protein FAM185A isoform X1 [Lonchura striata domestica]